MHFKLTLIHRKYRSCKLSHHFGPYRIFRPVFQSALPWTCAGCLFRFYELGGGSLRLISKVSFVTILLKNDIVCKFDSRFTLLFDSKLKNMTLISVRCSRQYRILHSKDYLNFVKHIKTPWIQCPQKHWTLLYTITFLCGQNVHLYAVCSTQYFWDSCCICSPVIL